MDCELLGANLNSQQRSSHAAITRQLEVAYREMLENYYIGGQPKAMNIEVNQGKPWIIRKKRYW